MPVDSNILIYATKPEYAELRRWLVEALPQVIGHQQSRNSRLPQITCGRKSRTYGIAEQSGTDLPDPHQLRNRHPIAPTCNIGDFAWINELKL